VYIVRVTLQILSIIMYRVFVRVSNGTKIIQIDQEKQEL